MIKEAYCSFEVAELLKEKGFNEPCYTCYINKELSHYDYLSTNFELIDNVISEVVEGKRGLFLISSVY